MKNKVLFLVIGVIAIIAAIFFYNKYRVAKRIDIEALSLTDVNGKQVKLSQFKDKKLFLNFFATWCGPCLQELQALETAQSILKEDQFLFLLISDEPLERLKEFQEGEGSSLTILHSRNPLTQEQIFTLPTSYLLNLEGKIVFDKVGVAEWDSKEMIKELKDLAE
jgi:peroxiredoxin